MRASAVTAISISVLLLGARAARAEGEQASAPDEPRAESEASAFRAQAAAAQRAREEAELQERMAASARAARDKQRSAQLQALTPPYLSVMKWGGLGLAAAGAITAIATYSAFDEKKTTEPAYDRLRLGNDLGWVAIGVGMASFGLSFVLRPSLGNDKSSAQRSIGLDLRPNAVQVRWCF